MAKAKKIFLLILAVMLVISVCSAEAAEHIENVVYETEDNTVTASVKVTADNKKRVLVLSAYKDGFLEKITADSRVVNGTVTLEASIDKTGTDEIIATVVDAFDGDVLLNEAVYGTDSTSLEYIKINGEEIAYDDNTDEYWVQYSKEPVSVDVSVKDGTTKAAVSDYELPGNVEIDVVSSSGEQRKIVLHLYRTEDDLNKLNGIKYMIDGKVYEVEGFSPNKKQYKIELPDNVLGVTLLPEAVSDVSCMISNSAVETIDGVSLGSFYSTGKDAYQYKHNARNNYIPIKNETTTAYVTVKSGDKTNEYQFEFVSKQPRLTSFEYVGAKDDSHKPVFIGGSALNNDNGTVLSMDRRWGIGNISEALLGGSCFMLPAENRNAGYWWNEHTSGEYFNFTADTKGTVYVLSGNSIINSEYSGWTVGNESAEPPGEESWITVAKDWNDYSAKYFATVIEYADNYARAVNPGIAANEGHESLLYPSTISNYAYKTFEAGEKVSVFHTGRTGQTAAKAIVVIVWDGVVGGVPKDAEETPKPEETEKPQITIEDEDKVMSLVFDNNTDTTSGKWLDNSGYNNDVTLYTDDNNKWTANGFMVTGGSAQPTQLPDAVKNAVSSNVFTIQFELSGLNYVSGKKCAILSSQNGDFEIYKSNSNDSVYFKWAGNTTALKMPKVTVSQMVGHLNTIVVDKNETQEAQRIRWYIDGTLVANKTMSATDKTADKIWLSNPNSACEGNAVFKSLTVYKKALTANEITGGSAE